ncbi:hypothetical protein SAMN04487936_104177 [Halobacillus dabanensis]|uniref:DUF7852 domain-containing protein n=1 Tax=Halobacillus dabanensis TaxID=240302 RepID=A0A1I3U5E5_HALDA|nr:DUF3794 domain-containing protein [Halobacillus dabanensis]SFJ78132.1 hypothetical protein SAMN04487936_104177 [Halobacillus dabanensis]
MRNNKCHGNCVNFNTSASIGQCTNTGPIAALVTPSNSVTIKVPVELGAYDVTSHLVANISFPYPVLEIKDIKKRVVITQCRLITRTSKGSGDLFSGGEFPLFIKGYVRKNIQYASPVHGAGGDCISSDIKSLTTKVHFECMTTVELDNLVQLPVANTSSEYDFFRAQDLGPGFPEKDQHLSSDLSQFHQISTQAYNEIPFCELIESEIIEWDEATDRKADRPVDEGCFKHIVEKMVLRFRIKVLQKQQVNINGI